MPQARRRVSNFPAEELFAAISVRRGATSFQIRCGLAAIASMLGLPDEPTSRDC